MELFNTIQFIVMQDDMTQIKSSKISTIPFQAITEAFKYRIKDFLSLYEGFLMLYDSLGNYTIIRASPDID